MDVNYCSHPRSNDIRGSTLEGCVSNYSSRKRKKSRVYFSRWNDVGSSVKPIKLRIARFRRVDSRSLSNFYSQSAETRLNVIALSVQPAGTFINASLSLSLSLSVRAERRISSFQITTQSPWPWWLYLPFNLLKNGGTAV